MEKLLKLLQENHLKQKELMKKMSKEDCNDIHSVLRSKQLAESIIELEVKRELLVKLITSK
jgi:hypothetical protein